MTLSDSDNTANTVKSFFQISFFRKPAIVHFSSTLHPKSTGTDALRFAPYLIPICSNNTNPTQIHHKSNKSIGTDALCFPPYLIPICSNNTIH